MQEEKEKRELPGALKTLAGVAIVFLLLAAVYVFYQAMQVLFPPNTYETALLATVEDTVDAEGVLLFNESYVAGDGTLGYLVADGERVSAGTAVAEVYSDASQAGLRQQLTQINDQIDLLQKRIFIAGIEPELVCLLLPVLCAQRLLDAQAAARDL